MTKRRPRRAVKGPAMRITRKRREAVDRLADALAEIAPATTLGKGFCVQKVAAEYGCKDCWKGGPNKRVMISRFLQNVFRRYPRKPKKVVLAIIKGGIEWRARKGQGVSREGLGHIADLVAELGVDVRKEARRLKLPQPSRVTEPPQDKAALLDRLELHQALVDDCAEMFRDGHFNEAVRKALERFEKLIQDGIDDHNTQGRDLMAKAFGGANPLIRLNALASANDRSEQEGFKFLTMGAMSGMRNLYSHGDVPQMSVADAIERLAFVSLLFKRVQQALKQEEA